MMNKQKQKEIQEEINEYRIREYSNEQKDEKYNDWRSDNWNSLTDDFVDERVDEFDNFCREVFKDEM